VQILILAILKYIILPVCLRSSRHWDDHISEPPAKSCENW